MSELYTGTMTIFPAKVRAVLAEKGVEFGPRWVPWSEEKGYEMPDIVLDGESTWAVARAEDA